VNSLRRKVVLGAAATAGQLMLSASAMAKQKIPTSVGADKLDLERFVEDCIAANSETDASVAAFYAEALFQKDTAALSVDAVHSVTNPLLRFTGGIHIYGGDFFNTTRSQWNPETLEEEPSDGAVIRKMFERENERLGLSST